MAPNQQLDKKRLEAEANIPSAIRIASIRQMEEDIRYLVLSCPHEYEPTGSEGSARAQCVGCGDNAGWWCQSSPTHVCQYVVSCECCIYCGQPQERT